LHSAFTKQLQNFPVSASLLKFDVKISAETDNRRVPKNHEKRGIEKKRGLVLDQNHYNQSRLWSRLHTTLAQITQITPNRIYTEYRVLKISLLFRIFEQLKVALKNRVSPEHFHCIEYISYHLGFLSNFALLAT